MNIDQPHLEQLGKTRFSKLEWVERTGSTNADLRQRAEQGAPEGIVLVADYQTQGRGRRNRKWESPPKASLLMSLLLRTKCLPEEMAWLTHMAGLAVADVCRETTGHEARLKWPNDVVVDDMKLAGVLAEVVPGAVVLGIGLNVSWPDAKSQPPGFSQVPVSLKALADRKAQQSTASAQGPVPDQSTAPAAALPAQGRVPVQSTAPAAALPAQGRVPVQSTAPATALPAQLPDRAELLVKLLVNFEQRYARVGQPDWSAELRAEVKQRSATLGRRVSIDMNLPAEDQLSPASISSDEKRNEIRGVAKDITPRGSLLVALDVASGEPQQQLEVTAGDVVHLRSEAS